MSTTNSYEIPEGYYTYEWANAEHENLKRTDPNGKVCWIPAVSTNSEYKIFLETKAQASPYIAPE